jgi:hypothetical protein
VTAVVATPSCSVHEHRRELLLEHPCADPAEAARRLLRAA